MVNVPKLEIDNILSLNYEFLLIRKVTTLPGIGRFKLNSLHRKYNVHYYTFEPKKYEIVFETDDSSTLEIREMLSFLAAKYKISTTSFEDIWKDFVQSLKEEIIQKTKYPWYNLGFFFLSRTGDKILFEPNQPFTLSSKFSQSLVPLSLIVNNYESTDISYSPSPDSALEPEEKITYKEESQHQNEKPEEKITYKEESDKPEEKDALTKNFNIDENINTVLFYDDDSDNTPSIELNKNELSTPSSQQEGSEELNFNNLEFTPSNAENSSSSQTSSPIQSNQEKDNPNHDVIKEQQEGTEHSNSSFSNESTKNEASVLNDTSIKKRKYSGRKYKSSVITYIIIGLIIAYLLFHFFLYDFSSNAIYNK